MSEFKRTKDHDEIRAWIEKHNGRPAVLSDTTNDDIQGLLYIHFGLGARKVGAPISWEEFFDRFDEARVVFRYNDEVIRGMENESYSFVSNETNPSELKDADEEVSLPEDSQVLHENLFPGRPARYEAE
jgi:hypothetical protein